MIVLKWNYEKWDYEPHEIPDEWHTPLYTDDMEETVNCAACGRELAYGDCYTSKEIHNSYGLGYGVCKDCYNEESDRYVKFK